jgi:uncharacterized protein
MENQQSISTTKAALAALASGVLFGLGLVISEMMSPARVLGFLDITGTWDPTLMLVMVGALAITFPAFQLAPRMQKPVFDFKFTIPSRKDIDSPLIMGSILFGIGWGLVGLCPGPAVVGLSTLNPDVTLFFIAMLAGMLLHRFVSEKRPA